MFCYVADILRAVSNSVSCLTSAQYEAAATYLVHQFCVQGMKVCCSMGKIYTRVLKFTHVKYLNIDLFLYT